MKLNTALMIGALMISNLGHAAPVPELTNYLEEELKVFDDAVSRCSAPDDLSSTQAILGEEKAEERYLFRNFWLRARMRGGFELPGLVTVQVIPEVEMYWQRQVPEGWGAYKP